MTMTEGSGDDDAFAGVFDREAPQETPVETPNTETPSERLRDERGRFAPQTPPQQEAQAETQPQAEAPTQPDPNANRQVPLSEHLGERNKYKERISQIERAQLEAEARAKAYEQQIQQLLTQRQQPQPQPQQQVEVPDPYTDPQGWAQHLQNQVRQQMLVNRAEVSRRMADRQFGAEAVQQALQSAPVALCNQLFENSPDPFGDLMDWHKEQQVRKEVGTDLDAFKKRIEEEVRQKVLAELKAGGANGQPQPKFPGSLANATATGEQGAMLTEEAAMGSIFASGRNRRQ